MLQGGVAKMCLHPPLIVVRIKKKLMPDLSFMWLFCLALRATVLFAHIWQNLDSKLATESFVTCSPTRPLPHLKHVVPCTCRCHGNGCKQPCPARRPRRGADSHIWQHLVIKNHQLFEQGLVRSCKLLSPSVHTYTERLFCWGVSGCIILLILDQLSVKEARCLWNPSVGFLWTDSSWFEGLMLQLIIRRLLLPSGVSLQLQQLCGLFLTKFLLWNTECKAAGPNVTVWASLPDIILFVQKHKGKAG